MSYSIVFDETSALLKLRLCGFWDAVTVGEFVRALDAEIERLETNWPEFDTLIDATRFQVQSAEVVEGLEAIYQDSVKHGRSAVVLASALVRLQARQVLDDGNAQLFSSVDAAENWLISPRSGE